MKIKNWKVNDPVLLGTYAAILLLPVGSYHSSYEDVIKFTRISYPCLP